MELLNKIALVIHVIAGMTALVAGLIAILAKKGKPTHLKSGIIFFYSMLLVAATAIFIAIVKSNTFLLYIGIFSFFMVFSGYRSIKNKSLKPNMYDWIILTVALTNGVMMIYSQVLVLMVFGVIGCFLGISDFRIFALVLQKKKIPKNQWLLRHLGMMIGAYISTSTAFIVVNITQINYPWIPWLLPTIIGTPIIVYWNIKMSNKKKETL